MIELVKAYSNFPAEKVCSSLGCVRVSRVIECISLARMLRVRPANLATLPLAQLAQVRAGARGAMPGPPPIRAADAPQTRRPARAWAARRRGSGRAGGGRAGAFVVGARVLRARAAGGAAHCGRRRAHKRAMACGACTVGLWRRERRWRRSCSFIGPPGGPQAVQRALVGARVVRPTPRRSRGRSVGWQVG